MKVEAKPSRCRGERGQLGDRRRLAWLLSLALAVTALLLAAPAGADTAICGPGSGAGQCQEARGIAVDRNEGLLYVADTGNRRVDVFDADTGAFLRAFGWDVSPEGAPGDTPGDQLEVCTSSCQAGSEGSGSGQFRFLTGIAVDNDPTSPAFGDVYVFDGIASAQGNNRVQRFHPDGEFVLTFGDGVNQSTGGDVCTAASGDVCQAATQGFGVGQFSPDADPSLAVGPGGTVHVADTDVVGFDGANITENRVQRFDSNGAHLGQCSVATGDSEGKNRSFVRALVVNSSGDIYFGSGGGTGGVRRLDPACGLLGTLHPQPPNVSFSVQSLALDAADNLFVSDNSPAVSQETATYQYSPAGTLLRVFYGNGLQQGYATSLAPYSSATGDVFVAEGSGVSSLKRVVHLAFPPPGPVVHHALSKADPGNTKATLNARINPEGKATTFHFEYVDEATYLKDVAELGAGHGFDHAQATPEANVLPPEKPLVEPLFALGHASAQIGCPEPTKALVEAGQCLAPETAYRFRVVAENADGEDTGPEASFETGDPFEIGAPWSTKVSADSARIHAQVNPLNIPASGHFEYVDAATYLKDVAELGAGHGFEHAVQAPEIDFGSGEAPTTVGLQLDSLQPDTEYRYRLFVEDILGFAGNSEERVFRTFPPSGDIPPCPNDPFRAGASANLPDCRAYEMVSPVDKEGGEVMDAGHRQSAAVVPSEGRGFTYSSLRAFGDAAAAPVNSQYIASRVPDQDGEWDPEEGWHSHGISPPSEGALFGNLLSTEYKAFSEDLRYAWLRKESDPPLDSIEPAAIAGYRNLYRRDNVNEDYKAACPTKPTNEDSDNYFVVLQGFSAESDLTVFRANGKLPTPKALPKKGIYQLYGCKGEELRLLSVLPGGQAGDGDSSLGTRYSEATQHYEDSLHNALAADGSRLYWTDADTEGGPGRIYLRENAFGEGGECAGEGTPCTVEVSESVAAQGAEQEAHFWTASPGGAVAIFSFTQGPLAGNLYEFDAASKTSSLIAEGVSGVAGYSEDASRLYLLSKEVIEGEPGAIEGEPNLYLYEAGEGFTWVTAFPGGVGPGDNCAIDQRRPSARCTRATPDGLQLAFMSSAKLSDYDNLDAASGEADTEVYLYDATADGGKGELHCASCNPSGARPSGRFAPLNGSWVAAQIPPSYTSFHAPRVLSADGRRLFFESFDALVLSDTNGALDVYQWEAAGKGGCDTGDAGYFASNGGCVDLISSGKSPQDVTFLDASADGSDVFFNTGASLLPQDPGLLDVYDARIEGGFPPLPSPQPPCEGEACQSPPAPPQAIAPSSSSFRGAGNQGTANGAKRRCPKGKRRVTRRGRARCVKRRAARRQRQGQPLRGRAGR